jgi:hypothetical protein
MQLHFSMDDPSLIFSRLRVQQVLVPGPTEQGCPQPLDFGSSEWQPPETCRIISLLISGRSTGFHGDSCACADVTVCW